MHNYSIVVCARMASTRLPGKPLIPLCGKPSILYPLEAALATGKPVILATDSTEIGDLAPLGVDVRFVYDGLNNGTERAALAVRPGEAKGYIVLAGDEVTARPDDLWAFHEHACDAQTVATLVTPGNAAGAVTTAAISGGNIQYLGRGRISDYTATGIYYYPAELLFKYMLLGIGPLEADTGIELQRMIEHGYPVRAIASLTHPGLALNTPADVTEVEAWLSR